MAAHWCLLHEQSFSLAANKIPLTAAIVPFVEIARPSHLAATAPPHAPSNLLLTSHSNNRYQKSNPNSYALLLALKLLIKMCHACTLVGGLGTRPLSNDVIEWLTSEAQ